MSTTLRLAELDDAPTLKTLIEDSVMALQAGDYTEAQRRGALGTVFGVDSQLIKDKTYFVVESDGMIVGCGGWSRRQTLFGGDAISGKNDRELDPLTEAARIRAFFVKPGYERRGIGRQILQACEAAAAAMGFARLDLVATLTGIALYAAHGYQAYEHYEIPLPNGLALSAVKMTKQA